MSSRRLGTLNLQVAILALVATGGCSSSTATFGSGDQNASTGGRGIAGASGKLGASYGNAGTRVVSETGGSSGAPIGTSSGGIVTGGTVGTAAGSDSGGTVTAGTVGTAAGNDSGGAPIGGTAGGTVTSSPSGGTGSSTVAGGTSNAAGGQVTTLGGSQATGGTASYAGTGISAGSGGTAGGIPGTGGATATSCIILSKAYESGKVNPLDTCVSCQPAVSSIAWSPVADGTSCLTDNFCVTGSCQSGCWINSKFYAPGVGNPSNTCQSCQPDKSKVTWANVPTKQCGLAISASNSFTCANANGGAYCWGWNLDGQLGNGTFLDSPVPVVVDGLATGITGRIATGTGGHGCAVENGGVTCWGRNGYGQLGYQSINGDPNPLPTTVSSLASGVSAVAAGVAHNCAVANGSAYCWGYNFYGQLGIGSKTNTHVPTKVDALGATVTGVFAGDHTSCATTSGNTYCWGKNTNGRLGDWTTTDSSSPVVVQDLPPVANMVSVGAVHTCAVVNAEAYCWGENSYGKLGDGTTLERRAAVKVTDLPAGIVTAVAAGTHFTCAIVNGSAYCWGYNERGTLGNNTTQNSPTPVQVTGLTSGVTAISAAGSHACAIANGIVYCWGGNFAGELGVLPQSPSLVPVRVQFP